VLKVDLIKPLVNTILYGVNTERKVER